MFTGPNGNPLQLFVKQEGCVFSHVSERLQTRLRLPSHYNRVQLMASEVSTSMMLLAQKHTVSRSSDVQMDICQRLRPMTC